MIRSPPRYLGVGVGVGRELGVFRFGFPWEGKRARISRAGDLSSRLRVDDEIVTRPGGDDKKDVFFCHVTGSDDGRSLLGEFDHRLQKSVETAVFLHETG